LDFRFNSPLVYLIIVSLSKRIFTCN